MKKNIWKIIGIITVVSLSCSSSQTKNGADGPKVVTETATKADEPRKVSDYFPSKTLTKIFSGGFENEGMKHIVLSVENNEVQILQEDTGTNLIMVYKVSENQIEMVFSEAEYYSTQRIERVEPNRNSIILKAPLEVGNKWKHEFDGFLEITAVDLELKTPAGTFNALEVTYSYNDYITKYYYAKELGLIKTVSDFATIQLLEVK